MATVQLNQIRKVFDSTEIIKGIDLTIHDRELTVFVGPSGCGKSTLLRLIAGLEEITSGELLIDGQRVNDVPAARRGLALVFQSYALYPHMSVEENMSFSLKLGGVSKVERKRKVLEAARILNLETYLDRKPKELSGGQRQRVAIGRAIVRNPRVFLFDEPLSNLDAALRVRMRLELTKLHHQLGATMIYVTHDQVEAMTMADRIVVLRAGIIEQVGTPMDLYHYPRNLFVAGFIGSPRMNFLEATVQADSKLLLSDNVSLPISQLLQPDAKVTIGIRPEHLILTTFSESSIPAKVQIVEHLGSESYVHLQTTGGELLVLRVNGETAVRPDDQVHLNLDPKFVHLFDSAGNTMLSN
ncbi:ABC transporter ATP-binding protein [Granulicella arctica]|uniref:ABC transporter ATP-binding protein n=1 Tax=Granulicella arctica TaxID=940613 RepID=UPI0021DF7228|nr:sn-glycerol-3-phosphate ABC transporter ATP-binding protein UgpC [Granulicella arctica]